MELIKLSAIASTNSYLKEICTQMQPRDATVVWAESQTEGRGQRGTSWQSEPGKSLTFSLLKRFSIFSSADHILINMATSIGVAKALDLLKIPKVAIKWPNDIMSYDKKLCGILIENQLKGKLLSSSIIGIGLNINNSKFDNLPHAGSLFTITGKNYELEAVLELLVKCILEELEKLETSSFNELKTVYEPSLFRKDEISVFEHEDGTLLNGIIRGISVEGNLCVELEDERWAEFSLKEIKLRY
ncbi:MAG: biotin--[acetyl-CoA-carboxylase] ligase [Flavobacterium sp.]|nr:MAG: biotin--[acetyl-CoA-carboxylase] ligase [Flavobacterium sp.]